MARGECFTLGRASSLWRETMSIDKVPITIRGYAALEEELKHRQQVERQDEAHGRRSDERDGVAPSRHPSAVRAAQAVGYENAGTVEFLLAEGEVYFMEMNTRVQVEHTITEEITGIDIVREQIRIASGLQLSVKQEDIIHRGYALQFRINAEDPKNNFLPSFGKITRYYAPGGPGVRTDTAIYTGYTIPPYYDSMCLKLVVWALTWEEALARGSRALDDMRVQGVKTTATYYQQILANPDFRSGQFNTSFVDNHPELLNYSIKRKPGELALAIAAAIAAHAGL